MDLIFDIETDDLKATKIWCIVAQDSDSGKIYMFAPHQLESGLELLQKADRLIGHNIIGFDIPVIKKLHGVDLSDKELVDTLVMSRLFNPVREGGHSLEMWGYRLKYPKKNFDDYKNYSSEMLDYCRRDVQLNALVLRKLTKEGSGFSKESVHLEQEVSKILKEQASQDHVKFGLDKISVDSKRKKISKLFNSISSNYDKMNDIMSLRSHRLWKKDLVERIRKSLEKQLYFADTFTLTGNLTVNDDLVLGKVKNDSTGQTLTHTAATNRTLTGTGTITMGGYLVS